MPPIKVEDSVYVARATAYMLQGNSVYVARVSAKQESRELSFVAVVSSAPSARRFYAHLSRIPACSAHITRTHTRKSFLMFNLN